MDDRTWQNLTDAQKIEHIEKVICLYGECLELDKWKTIIEGIKNNGSKNL